MNYHTYFRNVPKSTSFTNKTVVVPISVGQPYHEGDKFLAVIQRINKMPFSHCAIIVGDTLQRHNYQLVHACSLEQATHETYQEGTKWLERNDASLKLLTIPYSIARWQECLRPTPTFQSYHELITRLTQTDHEYINALESDAQLFVNRQQKKGAALSLLDQTKFKQTSISYIIEETTAFSYFEDHAYNFIIYPGRPVSSIALFIKQHVMKSNPDVMQWLHLAYKK